MKSHQTHAYWDYHLHNVLLNGVAVNGQSPFYSDTRSGTGTRLKRFNFNFDGYRYDTFQRNYSDTPYTLDDGGLLFRGRPLSRLPFSLTSARRGRVGKRTGLVVQVIPFTRPLL